jgi:glycosyltransferase involved in cell wall biosynthesis
MRGSLARVCYTAAVPLVSVLLPLRDAAPWLDASLASLSRQTFRDFEIVAVDDGSRDATPRVLERWAHREPRLQVVRSDARGLPSALETARARARGAWLARHDGDDLSHRERLEAQLAIVAGDPTLAVVGCRVRLFPAAAVGAGMRRWAAWHNALLDHDAMAREAWIDSPLCHGSALLRADALAALGGWRETGHAEDVDLWLRAFAAGLRFAKVPRALYAWRQRPDSATRRDPRYARARMIGLKAASLPGRLARADAPLQVVGVGTSLAEWSGALASGDRRVSTLVARSPTQAALARLAPPLVLVFGAVVARARWRSALVAAGLVELGDFVFVA